MYMQIQEIQKFQLPNALQYDKKSIAFKDNNNQIMQKSQLQQSKQLQLSATLAIQKKLQYQHKFIKSPVNKVFRLKRRLHQLPLRGLSSDQTESQQPINNIVVNQPNKQQCHYSTQGKFHINKQKIKPKIQTSQKIQSTQNLTKLKDETFKQRLISDIDFDDNNKIISNQEFNLLFQNGELLQSKNKQTQQSVGSIKKLPQKFNLNLHSPIQLKNSVTKKNYQIINKYYPILSQKLLNEINNDENYYLPQTIQQKRSNYNRTSNAFYNNDQHYQKNGNNNNISSAKNSHVSKYMKYDPDQIMDEEFQIVQSNVPIKQTQNSFYKAQGSKFESMMNKLDYKEKFKELNSLLTKARKDHIAKLNK